MRKEDLRVGDRVRHSCAAPPHNVGTVTALSINTRENEPSVYVQYWNDDRPSVAYTRYLSIAYPACLALPEGL